MSATEVPPAPGAVIRHVVGVAAFGAVFVVSVAVGRATRLEGSALALVWPAAAVGFCWMAASWRRPWRRVADLALITVLAAVINHVTGAPWPLAVGLGVSSGLQALVGGGLMAHLQARPGSSVWRLRSTSDLAALLVATSASAVVGAGVGCVALHLTTGGPLLAPAGAWVLRLASSAFVFSAVALRVTDREVWRPLARRQIGELLVVGTVLVIAYGAVFSPSVHVQLAFVLVPLSLWVALRFDTTIAAGHVMLVGVFVVLSTMAGDGPFAVGPVSVQVSLAQAFVSVVALVTMVAALDRDERHRLTDRARQLAVEAGRLAEETIAACQRADEQAALLEHVLAAMSEGVALVDADGRFLVRNPAVAGLMGVSSPTGSVSAPGTYGLFLADGQPCPPEQMVNVRALAGEHVSQDMILRNGAVGERVLAVTGTPLSTATGGRQALLVFSDVTSDRRAAAEVARTRDLLAGVLDAATEFAIISTDLGGSITVFSVGAEKMLGYTAAEMVGQRPAVFHDPIEVADRARELGVDLSGPEVAEVFAGEALRGGNEIRQWTFLHRDGKRVPVLLTTSPVHDATGAPTGFMGLARDLSAQLAAQAELADSEQRFRLAFDSASVGMMLVGLQAEAAARVLRVNTALAAFTGRTESALLGSDVHALTHAQELDEFRATFAALARGEREHVKVEKRYVHADGSTRWGLLSASTVHPGGELEPYLLCLVEDITARKEAEEVLTHQLHHDPLTGLPNRSLLTERLSRALHPDHASAPVGVLFLDLDGFKAVNDTAGHAAGDQLLQQVAVRIARSVRPSDTVARLGGDEFAIICPDIHAGDPARAEMEVHAVALRVLGALGDPFVLHGGTFTIGASIGSQVAEPGTDPATALRDADQAMYGAKRAGKNRVHGSREPMGVLAAP